MPTDDNRKNSKTRPTVTLKAIFNRLSLELSGMWVHPPLISPWSLVRVGLE